MKLKILLPLLFLLTLSFVSANLAEYEQVMEWQGELLSFYPITGNVDLEKAEFTTDEVKFETADGYEFKIESDKMEITKDKITLFEITSTQDYWQKDDLRVSKEWGYFGSGVGTDIIVASGELIRKGNYICLNEYTTSGYGLNKRNYYKDCLYYPEVYDDDKNIILVNISIINNKAIVNYPLPYDPLTSNFTEGLIGCWPLDSLNESTGKYNLTDTGSVDFVSGHIGNSANFTPDNDYLYTDIGSAMNAKNITISLWAKGQTGTNKGMLAQNSDGILFQYDTTIVKFWPQTCCQNADTSSFSSGDGVWKHFVATYSRPITTLYVDGVNLTNTASADVDLKTTGGGTLNFGTWKSGTRAFDGLLDEVAIWNYELNSSQIQELYNSGSGVSCQDIIDSGSGNATPPACSPSFVNTTGFEVSNGTCEINDFFNTTWNVTQYDENDCNGSVNTTFLVTNQTYNCDFCTPNGVYTSFTYNSSSCAITDTFNRDGFRILYDENDCFAITGLPSDIFVNVTEWDNQTGLACNYCSYSLVYGSYNSWSNVTCGTRNRTVVDGNWLNCCGVTNISTDCYESDTIAGNFTYYDYQNLACVEPAETVTSVVSEPVNRLWVEVLLMIALVVTVIYASINALNNKYINVRYLSLLLILANIIVMVVVGFAS